MQLLGHVVFYVSIKLRATHGIGIVLEGGRAEVASTWVPRGNNAPGEGALVVGSGTIVVSMVSGKAPVADFPEWAVVFIVVGGLLIALEAVGESSGGVGLFVLLARQ